MTGVATLGRSLRSSDHRAAALQVAAGLAVGLIAALVAVAVNPAVAAGVAGGVIIVLVGLRWPLIPLLLFVALVPFDDTLVIPGVGTLSRIIGIVFAAVYAAPRIGRLSIWSLSPAAWGLLGWAALSLLWAIRPDTSIGALQTLLQAVVIAYLIADVVRNDPTTVRPILWAYSISAATTAALGVVAFGLSGLSTDTRVAALAGQNPAQYASLLLPAFIFGLYQAINRRWVMASGPVALLCFAGIVISGTRAVWLAAVVVVFLLMVPRLGARRALALLIGVGIVALVTLQIPSVAGLIASRVGTATASGGAGRTDIWAAGLGIFLTSPIIGVGYFNFAYAVAETSFHSANLSAQALLFLAPHSVIVGPAVELGIVGLALIALLVVPLVIRPGWGPDGPIVQAILAALMIDALFIDIFGYRKEVWIAIGLASGLAYIRRQDRRGRLAADLRPSPDTPPDKPGVAGSTDQLRVASVRRHREATVEGAQVRRG